MAAVYAMVAGMVGLYEFWRMVLEHGMGAVLSPYSLTVILKALIWPITLVLALMN